MWLLKTEPGSYGYDDLERDGRTTWDGVTNPVALRNLREMKAGDEVAIYHTGDEKAAVGRARVVRAAYPDPKAGDPRRVVVDLEAAGRLGLPQVVSLGALDMVNFGARATVPPQFEDRNLYVHNPSVTLMRTTKDEMVELGRQIARKLSAATGRTALFIPLKGVSMIDAEGQPFHDAEADAALFQVLRDEIGDHVELIEMDNNVNDPEFADAMADKLDEYMKS